MKRSTKILVAIGIILLVFAIACGGYLLYQYITLSSAVNVISDVKSSVESTTTATLPSSVEKELTLQDYDNNDDSSYSSYFDSESDYNYVAVDPMRRRIDFASLKAINSDVYSWIYIPNTQIDYYIMQEPTSDSHKYLWSDIYGNYSSTGSLLTYTASDNIEDAHRIIYGHHLMGYPAMFTELVNYKSESYTHSHPYVYMYYADRVERWKVWAPQNVLASNAVYTMPYILGSDEYSDLLTDLHSDASVTYTAKPNADTKTLVLSTCDSPYRIDDGRYVVCCVPDVAYYYDSHKLVSMRSENNESSSNSNG